MSQKKSGAYYTPTYKFSTAGIKPECDVVALVALDIEKIWYAGLEDCLHKDKIWVPTKRMVLGSDAALLSSVQQGMYPITSMPPCALVNTPRGCTQPSHLPLCDSASSL